MMIRRSLVLSCLMAGSLCLRAQSLITEKASAGDWPLADAVIYADSSEEELVKKSASFLQQDISLVTGKKLSVVHQWPANVKRIIIVGTPQNSSQIKQLSQSKKIDLSSLAGNWEAFLIQTIARPFPGIDHALVIAGSDRRGTAFGVFELSRQLGVSPWYWWADVPVKKRTALFVKANKTITDAPRVKYRGIFINDEAPALSNWSKEKFGGFNHLFYEKVFELILRLKGNYIWPAMWGNAFYDDDPLNIKAADDFGIVIGTSHHEPLMRAHDEWRRYGTGKWNYDSNEVRLKEFWRGGMIRAVNEKIVSIGMRGDGDEPMSRETATALLERIVQDQRRIIEEVTGKPASETPQLWALYKEVQDYYDKGMRVPDDVTLLLCDDNWGNIRRLPQPSEPERKGGYGIYYHFDYVGGPRNYKWVNTNPLPRIWEQMHLAWQYRAREIWIVNVGDIKPMEFPISFFLDYAWNPEKIGADDLQRYTEEWAAEQFGEKQAKEIGDILAKYGKYNGRRKPELLDQNTYSLNNYQEFKRVVDEYNQLLKKAERVNESLQAEYRDAFFQLALHPVKACANLNELYFTVALNREAYQNRLAAANGYADKAKELYIQDSLITLAYHRLRDGKWNHMMSQTHIGYTYWQQPPRQKMPEVKYVPADSVTQQQASLAYTSKNSRNLIPASGTAPVFYEEDGVVSMEADHFTRAVNSQGITWKLLPDHGRTGSAVTSFPVTARGQELSTGSPHLEYEFCTYSKDSFRLNAYFSPTLNFLNSPAGLLFAVSVDDEEPQVISLNRDDNNMRSWNRWAAENIIIKSTQHQIEKPGKHVLKYWKIDPGIVLQKLVLDLGGLKPSYLGPPETLSK